MKRNPDGTYRNARHAIVVSARFIVGRWVSAEIMACKRKGLSMAAISNHITCVGQGLEQALCPLPDGIAFPRDYRISESAVYKAYHKVMVRQPAIDAEVYLKEDTARLEDMYQKLQPGIIQGDPRHIDTAVRLLAHKAKLNVYAAQPDQVGTAGSFQIQINLGDTHEDDE